ncbi:MAG: hypothetical protein JXQ26_07185 [Tissierellales bacterium]|nr:hypothetical protein [Tissierellales bacterium]MBN2827756.1 hypothetical protein [Tissierellales bacterium]
MPFITVKVSNKTHKIDPEKLGRDICEQSGLELHRVNVIVDYLPEGQFFTGRGNDYPFIIVQASIGNGKDFIQNLISLSASLVEKQLNLPESSLIGMAHPIEKDYLYVAGQFR